MPPTEHQMPPSTPFPYPPRLTITRACAVHSKTVSYAQPGRARSEVEAKVNAALIEVASGMGLRQAARKHDAPFTSLNRLWV